MIAVEKVQATAIARKLINPRWPNLPDEACTASRWFAGQDEITEAQADEFYTHLRTHRSETSPTGWVSCETAADDIMADDAAAIAGVKVDTWHGYVSRGQAPAPVFKNGRYVAWSRRAVEEWVDERPGRGNWGERTS